MLLLVLIREVLGVFGHRFSGITAAELTLGFSLVDVEARAHPITQFSVLCQTGDSLLVRCTSEKLCKIGGHGETRWHPVKRQRDCRVRRLVACRRDHNSQRIIIQHVRVRRTSDAGCYSLQIWRPKVANSKNASTLRGPRGSLPFANLYRASVSFLGDLVDARHSLTLVREQRDAPTEPDVFVANDKQCRSRSMPPLQVVLDKVAVENTNRALGPILVVPTVDGALRGAKFRKCSGWKLGSIRSFHQPEEPGQGGLTGCVPTVY